MILTLCPTKGRPEQCLRMVKSFHKTFKEDNKLVLIFNSDDKRIDDYEEVKNMCDMFHVYPAGQTLTQMINESASLNNGLYTHYHITNDDVIYQTDGWDTLFLECEKENGPGIFYGNDLVQGRFLPTFPFISSLIVKAVGWLQHPSINHYYPDVIWKMLGNMSDTLHYLFHVIIEHQHNFKDQGYIENKEIYTKDKAAFAEWLRVSHRDVKKIKDAIKV